MEFKTDIQIAQETVMQPIMEVAKTADIDEKYLEQYGRYKAKIDNSLLTDYADRPDGKLVLVTAITPPRQAKARPPRPWVWQTVCAALAKTPSSPCANRALARCLA